MMYLNLSSRSDSQERQPARRSTGRSSPGASLSLLALGLLLAFPAGSARADALSSKSDSMTRDALNHAKPSDKLTVILTLDEGPTPRRLQQLAAKGAGTMSGLDLVSAVTFTVPVNRLKSIADMPEVRHIS